jgi:hypothetical protein
MVDTPHGDTPIEQLQTGDAIWSVSETGERIKTIIQQVARRTVPPGHMMAHVRLADGREIMASPGHPTADGRTFGEVRAGDSLDGTPVSFSELIAFQQTSTYDILPAGPTGLYWANGILMGSTLRE